MSKKISCRKLIFIAVGLLLFAGVIFFLLSGDNLAVFKSIFRKGITGEEIRETVRLLGFKGYISVILLAMLQVLLMFLPAEPVQVVAGMGYGLWTGVLLCAAGVVIANTVIYVCYKIFGGKMNEYYEKNVNIDWHSAKTARNISIIVFVLYLLPAIPYGMICFFAASSGLKYPRFIILTLLGSLPSVFIGVGLGHVAIASSFILAAIIFAVLLVVIIIMFVKKDALTAKLNAFIKEKSVPYSSDTTVRKPSRFVAFVFVTAFKVYLFFMFKIKFKNLAGKLKKPSVVLVNHAAFIDFMFSLKYLKKYLPNIVAARLYFYHKTMGFWMKRGGVIPKSMFAADMENVKNCMRVMKNGGMLLMMPEARLSTVGRYEGVQETTIRFLQKLNVEIYMLKLHGNYFAMPKWGDKPRKGAHVECTLSQIYSPASPVADYDEFKALIDGALDYDEFEWLKSRPELKYKSKTLAEGLEGVLYMCPECKSECTIETSGREIRCTHCGLVTELTDRYAFKDNKPFADFREWYDFEYAELKKQVDADENYKLVAKVELRHSSNDGKTCTRRAGEGICTLTREGLLYEGTEDGKNVSVSFNGNEVHRLLFGVNEDFEIYRGKEIYYFVPEERRICVKWYLCSTALKEYYKK